MTAVTSRGAGRGLGNEEEVMKNRIRDALVGLTHSTDRLHRRFDIDRLHPLDRPGMDARLRLLLEEHGELARAITMGDRDNIVEEAIDCAVVALGTVLLLGDDAVLGALGVVQKLDAKTHETHEMRGGKIARKAHHG